MADVVKSRGVAAAGQSSRLVAIDVARVIAVVFMIQGHALDVLLAPEYRQGIVFDSWLFLRGLTAPMFFMLSGVSFAISTMKHWDEYSRVTWRVFRRIRRFAFFILLGYVMHLPARSFQRLRHLDAEAWQSWLLVDVLQCVGITLLLLQLMVLAAKTPKRFALWSTAAGVFAVAFAPIAWAMNWPDALPLAVVSYFTAQTGSLFPIFPWAAFVLLGCGLGYWLVQGSEVPVSLPARQLALAGAAIILVGSVLVSVLPAGHSDTVDLWKVRPGFFLIRLGAVGALLALVEWITPKIRIPERAMRSIAEESLLIYFVHVCILYGCVWFSGFRQFVGATLDVLPTFGWIAVLVATMLLMGWAWNWLKRNSPTQGLLVRTAVVLLAVLAGLRS